MNGTEAAYREIEERFAAWARIQPDIRAAFVVGSRARVDDHPADEWADLDIMIVTSHPHRYLSRGDWTKNFGRVWLTFVEPTPAGGAMERRAIYEGCLDVDFAVIPSSRVRPMAYLLTALERFPFLQRLVPRGVRRELGLGSELLRRGMRVIIDRDGLAEKIPLALSLAPPPAPPSRGEFRRALDDFWHHAPWTAKHLRRGELWWAKSSCDGRLKQLLLQMMEWHARATRGWDLDTWQRGRFLEQWADPRAVEALPHVFARYNQEDVWRALFASMDLFRWLAMETAQRLSYPYPALADERVTEWVKRLAETRPHGKNRA